MSDSTATDATQTATPLGPYFEHCHRRAYPPGSMVINAGDFSNSLYYIVSGSVSVIIEDDDGHEIVLAYLNAGDFFGEIGLFDEKHERSAWVRTRTGCQIAGLAYDRLCEITRESPDIVFAMLAQLALRVRDTSRKVGDLAFKDVAGRIARALLDLCEQPDAEHVPEGTAIQITRQELGRIVGCSREMASRVLRALEEQGVVAVAGRTVTVIGAFPPEPPDAPS
jgi:CRP/FNR family cyclic AMP-dependent transcriptional regulator